VNLLFLFRFYLFYIKILFFINFQLNPKIQLFYYFKYFNHLFIKSNLIIKLIICLLLKYNFLSIVNFIINH